MHGSPCQHVRYLDDVFSPDVKMLINSQAALGLEQLPPLVFASDGVIVHIVGEQSFFKDLRAVTALSNYCME